MPKPTLRHLVETETPLVMPLAHDALTARLIERAGFRCVGIGGSALLAARYGLPDIGLAGFGEMLAGIRDVIAATSLPLVVDGDDGYGDVVAVAHMVETYARLGVAGIVLEDQMRVAKQPGDAGAVAVVPPDEMIAKLRVAVATCAGTDLRIIARCDAYKLEGLDGALRRGERYLAAGAHGIFIPGVATPEELAAIGTRFRGAHLMTVQFEGRKTWLPPAELHAMGFRHVALPGLLLPRVVDTMDRTLADLRRFVATGAPLPAYAAEDAKRALDGALDFDKWKSIAAQMPQSRT
ncbi:MAG: isocitrate lyase/PEP mutase family protein [Alphaproteobacteria bacterium]|nr:isocitrate lyase/PEP mutase family protein [Alphaproteobacteria bacterium]